MATVEPARTIFQQLSKVDLGDWSAARLVAAARDLGWTVDDDAKPTSLETGLATGPAIVVPSPAEGCADGGNGSGPPPDGGRGRGPRIAAVRVPVGAAGTFADAVEAATAVTGYPPPMIGGPGPWVRWRRPPGHDGTPGTSIGLLRADGTVWVELIATAVWESQARHWFDEGDGVDELPYRWLACRRHPSVKGLSTGERLAEDWGSLERGIALTLDDLLDDLVALGMPSRPPQAGTVRFTRQGRDIATFVDLTLGPGRELRLRRTGAEGLDALGWHRLERHTWSCEWLSAGPRECAEAASVITRTMREVGRYRLPSDPADHDPADRKAGGPAGQAGGRAAMDAEGDARRPAYAKPKLAGRTQVDLPGLGIPRSRDNG